MVIKHLFVFLIYYNNFFSIIIYKKEDLKYFKFLTPTVKILFGLNICIIFCHIYKTRLKLFIILKLLSIILYLFNFFLDFFAVKSEM